MTRLPVILLLLLAACGNPLRTDESPPTHYKLNALRGDATPKRALVVEVATPDLAEGLDTDRIALVEQGRRQQYFADGRWPGELGDVLQDFIVSSLNRSGVTAVTTDSPVAANYRIVPKIEAFHAAYEGGLKSAPAAEMDMQFLILSQPDNRIVGDLAFAERRPTGNNLSAVVTELERSSQTAMQGLVEELGMLSSGSR